MNQLTDYRGRRVLITGHTGFKGGWLALWLAQLGARVYGLALPPDTSPSLYQTAQLEKLLDSHMVDVRDGASVRRVVTQAEPEIVFHLAAQPLVLRSYREPVETFATNVMGTVHVLEAVRQTPSVRAVIVITTDKCYKNHDSPWGYRETDPLGGHDPYSASKACTELVAEAWRSSYGQADAAPLIATARAGNVIGGGDWAQNRLVPDIVRAAGAGQPVLIRNPTAVRPWQHVLDPLAGYLQLGLRLLAGERRFADAWNFGPALEDMQPVSTLCHHLCPPLGAHWLADNSSHPAEAKILRLDSSRAMLELGWRHRWPLAQALHATAQWYARQAAGEDARALTLEQINAYASLTGDQA